MTYELALAYLASLDESRIKPGLERIKGALRALGSPHLKFPHILVGGTNGKGSVASFLGSAWSKAGYRTGLYTSPHLSRFEERIVSEGRELSEHQLPGLVEAVMNTGVELTYFEFATAMAILHFAEEKLDLAVLEVGIGGAWDATNAADPALSVITSVDRDHQDWLGHRIEEIAREKAGILRRDRPAVVGRLEKAAADTILDHAGSKGAKVILAGRDYSFTQDTAAHSLHFRGARWDIKDLVPGLMGNFQLENAACALAAIETLSSVGFPVSRDEAINGISSAVWPGRFQEFDGSPAIIVDSAHNTAAAHALAVSLEGMDNIVWLFSALRDKDVEGMARALLSISNRFVLVPVNHPRALGVEELEDRVPENAFVTKSYSVMEGVEEARGAAGDAGCVVVAGSVVLAGEVLEILGTQYPVPSTQKPGVGS